MSAAPQQITVGQVYASTHGQDRAYGWRQRRQVVEVSRGFVWLRTLDVDRQPVSRVRLRETSRGQTIPAHRLVEDVAT